MLNDYAGGKEEMILGLGNPILWWTSTISMAWSMLYLFWIWLGKKKEVLDHPLTPLVIGYLAFFLPWVPIHRVLFLYHYLPCYAFALLTVVYWLDKLIKREQSELVIVLLLIAFALTIYFLPIWMGLPWLPELINKRIWFSFWL